MILGENITWKKLERESKIISNIILRLSQRMSRVEEAKRTEIMGEGRISNCRELYTPLCYSTAPEVPGANTLTVLSSNLSNERQYHRNIHFQINYIPPPSLFSD